MSEEKKKFGVCPECKVRDNDSSKKTLYNVCMTSLEAEEESIQTEPSLIVTF